MINNIITKDDLDAFKLEMIDYLSSLVVSKRNEPEWLKTKEATALMKVSQGTLRNLRIKGLLNPKKIEGTLYYSRLEIEKLLSAKIVN